METTKLFLTGNIESDKQVWDCCSIGLDWKIRQYKKALEIRKRIQENTIQKQIEDSVAYLERQYNLYAKYTKDNVPYIIKSMCADRIKLEEHRLNKLRLKEKFITGKEIGLSPASINKAKNFPIENLIDLDKRGFAIKNPFREEKTSSFYCKNNFWHDFGNGETGDVIDLAIKIYKIDFKSAIEKLNKKL